MLPRETKIRLWKNTFYWSLIILLFWVLYHWAWQGFFNFGSFTRSLAGASAVLIAVSFIFGTLTFYTDFLDSKLAYRKYFGLVGYWYAVLFVILLILSEPRKNFFEPLNGHFTSDQLLGLTAMLILTFMALISRDEVIAKIGPRRWRNSLRIGYLIYVVFIPRAVILEGGLWEEWAAGQASILPPPSLIASVLGILVILFRLSAYPAKILKRVFASPAK